MELVGYVIILYSSISPITMHIYFLSSARNMIISIRIFCNLIKNFAFRNVQWSSTNSVRDKSYTL